MSFSKPQVSFSSNFTSLFKVMKDNSSVLCLYTFNKRSLSKYKFGEISRSRKSTEELRLKTMKTRAKFKEKLTCGSKYDMKNLVNFHPTTQKPENFT